jgi:hypothetical protein
LVSTAPCPGDHSEPQIVIVYNFDMEQENEDTFDITFSREDDESDILDLEHFHGDCRIPPDEIFSYQISNYLEPNHDDDLHYWSDSGFSDDQPYAQEAAEDDLVIYDGSSEDGDEVNLLEQECPLFSDEGESQEEIEATSGDDTRSQITKSFSIVLNCLSE